MIRVSFKHSVRVIGGVHPMLFHHIEVVATVFGVFGIPELVVTSITDGRHSRLSRHYPTKKRPGGATDFRSRNVPQDRRVDLGRACAGALALRPVTEFRMASGDWIWKTGLGDFLWENIGTKDEHYHWEIDPEDL